MSVTCKFVVKLVIFIPKVKGVAIYQETGNPDAVENSTVIAKWTTQSDAAQKVAED